MLNTSKWYWNAERFGLTPKKILQRCSGRAHHRVLCIAIPKSGTHLFERAVCLCPGYYRNFIKSLTEKTAAPYGGIQKILNKQSPGQVLISHFSHSTEKEELFTSHSLKLFFVVRDLRDNLLSSVKFTMKRPDLPWHAVLKDKESLEERLLCMLSDGPLPNTHGVPKLYRWFEGWLDSGAEIMRFEELIGAKGGSTRNIQSDCLNRILSHIELPVSDTERNHILNQLYSPASPTFQKGQMGGWRDTFSEQVKDAVKEAAGDLLIRYGYEKNTNW